MVDLESLVGAVVPQNYFTQQLKSLGLTTAQTWKISKDSEAPKSVLLHRHSNRDYLKAEVDAYVSKKRAMLDELRQQQA